MAGGAGAGTRRGGDRTSRDHGYTAHITLAYVEPGTESPVTVPAGYHLAWNGITLAWGEEHTTYPLVDVTAAKSVAGTKAATTDWEAFDRKVRAYQAKAARKMQRFFAKQSRVIAATIRSRRGKSMQKALDGYFDRDRWDAELADDATDMFSDVIDSFGTWTMANNRGTAAARPASQPRQGGEEPAPETAQRVTPAAPTQDTASGWGARARDLMPRQGPPGSGI